MTQTEEVILEMMRENTGAHFLDSGGAYGRNFERNAKRDLAAEEQVRWEWDVENLTLDVTKRLYHFLKEALYYREDWDALFQQFSKARPDPREAWEDALKAFTYDNHLKTYLKELDKRNEFEQGVLDDLEKGCGFKLGVDEYTYNVENCLDQDFVWYEFETPGGDDILIIRTHNGCDARGGFSSPRFFEPDVDHAIHNHASIVMCCDNNERNVGQLNLMTGKEESNQPHTWDSYDGGYRWESTNDEIDLDKCPKETGDEPKHGTLVIKDKKTAFCPMCGGILSVYAY